MSATLKIHASSDPAIIAQDGNGSVLLAYGTTVPADGTPGFVKGALFQHVTDGAGTPLYCNKGTTDASDFNPVTVA